jgi:hypothetical protein
MSQLPSQEEIFSRYFIRWYEKEELEIRGHNDLRPDSELWGKPLMGAPDVSPLTDEGQKVIIKQIDEIYQAAKEDWPGFLKVQGEISLDWVDAFDKYLDKANLEDILKSSDPEDFSNELVVLCCEMGAVIGNCLIQLNPSLQWLPDSPYWDSAVYDATSGLRINVFHWAIRKFSASGLGVSNKEKVLECLKSLQKSFTDK